MLGPQGTISVRRLPLRLSVLDQSVAVVGRPHGQSIRDTIALAQLCEELGYHRFWVSEHHNHATIAGTAPEILIAAITSVTKRIRVGSAGVMLPHYSPLKVAEQFLVLEAIAPGRIDLGLGRAPGSDGRTAFALNPLANERPALFPNDVRDLMAWVSGGELPQGHHFRQVKAYPLSETVPEIWMLGSSDYGARLAAELGMPYAFAYFFTDGQGCEDALHLYRSLYKPSPRHPKPQATICVWALAAPTDDEARHLALSRERWRVDRARNLLGPLQAPDAIAARGFTAEEMPMVEAMRRRAFVGSAQTVRDKLDALAASLGGLDELVVNTWAHDPAVRRRSMGLVAGVYGLAPSVPRSTSPGA